MGGSGGGGGWKGVGATIGGNLSGVAGGMAGGALGKAIDTGGLNAKSIQDSPEDVLKRNVIAGLEGAAYGLGGSVFGNLFEQLTGEALERTGVKESESGGDGGGGDPESYTPSDGRTAPETAASRFAQFQLRNQNGKGTSKGKSDLVIPRSTGLQIPV